MKSVATTLLLLLAAEPSATQEEAGKEQAVEEKLTESAACADDCRTEGEGCQSKCKATCDGDPDEDCLSDCRSDCIDDAETCQDDCAGNTIVEELSAAGIKIRIEHDGKKKKRRVITERGDEERGEEVVVMGGSTRIEADEVVDSAVVMGGTLTILGRVRGDAVAIGGSIELKPGAVVEGDAVSMGGSIVVPEGATVEGERVKMEGGMGTLMRSALGVRGPKAISITVPSVGSLLVQLVLLTVLALLLLAFVPHRVERVRDHLLANLPRSAALGVAMLIAIAPICLMLTISIIGIALIPVVIAAAIGLWVMGITAFAGYLGDRLPILVGRKNLVSQTLLGMGLIGIVALIPFVGVIALLLLATVTAGAALDTRFGGRRKGGATDGSATPPPDPEAGPEGPAALLTSGNP